MVIPWGFARGAQAAAAVGDVGEVGEKQMLAIDTISCVLKTLQPQSVHARLKS
jgi:hypothetical protein